MPQQKPERRQLNVRLDIEPHEWLRHRAFRNYRSMNAELNSILSELAKKETEEGVLGGKTSSVSQQ